LPISFWIGFPQRLGQVGEIGVGNIDGHELGMVFHNEVTAGHVGGERQHLPYRQAGRPDQGDIQGALPARAARLHLLFHGDDLVANELRK
jgi:hypothetical protein